MNSSGGGHGGHQCWQCGLRRQECSEKAVSLGEHRHIQAYHFAFRCPKSLTVDNEDEEEERETPIDAHICGNCRQEFLGLSIFLSHKRDCIKNVLNDITEPTLPQQQTKEEEEEDIVEDMEEDKEDDNSDEEEDEESVKYPEVFESIGGEKSESDVRVGNESDNESEIRLKQMASSATNWPLIGPSLALSDTNVVIESLQNTSVAVAQHPPSSPDLIPPAVPQTALQSTLMNLQQQQMMLFHVIHQLQSQIASTGQSAPLIPTPLLVSPLKPTTPPVVTTPEEKGQSSHSTATVDKPLTSSSFSMSSSSKPIAPAIKTPPISTSLIPPNRTSGSVDSVNTSETSDRPLLTPLRDTTSPLRETSSPASPSEPNTLELLQRHTEQALQNTMSGGSFLLNGIAGMGSDFLSFRKTKDGKEDPMYRHRCKFCGKVFGSDSALQIHIRSHTGERPFKCNICGNRFTTKGNLKVHFQRHKAKYPHIKMNPHPVPEHLDKFHPPIEPPSGSQSPPADMTPLSTPPISMSQMFSQSLAQTFLDSTSSPHKDMKGLLGSSFGKHILDLNNSEHPSALSMQNNSSDNISNQSDCEDSDLECEDNIDDKEVEDVSEDEVAVNLEKTSNHIIKSEESPLNLHRIRKDVTEEEDLNEDEDMSADEMDREMDETERKEMADKDKENINSDDDLSDDSSDGMNIPPGMEFQYMPQFPHYFHSGVFPGIPTSMGLMPFGLPPGLPHVSSAGPQMNEDSSIEGRNPVFYQDLLPKPGSTDNTWETLMEVQKASETVKLQQLVDNIEHKLTDPNQCIICHRVLSCKSALQMHYRTHTGERPFKCKICGRAFTTKGNLKTHMGVHRVKPPLRILHQCPVCHKQFTNALVLQQHIRMHTGEPTDIPPEHIMANEIKAPTLMPSFQRSLMPPHFMGPVPPPAGLFGPPFMNGLTTTSSLNIPLSSAITSFSAPKPNLSPILSTEHKLDKTSSVETPECKRESISPSVSHRSSRVSTPDSPKSEKVLSKSPKQARSRSPSPIPADLPTPSAIPQPVIVSTPTPNQTVPSSAPMNVSTHSNDSVNSSFSTSLAALENHVKTINSSVPQPMPFGPFGLGLYNLSQFQRLESEHNIRVPISSATDLSVHNKSNEKSLRSCSPSSMNSKITSDISADDRSTPDSSLGTLDRSSPATTPTNGALDLTPKSQNNGRQSSVSQDMPLLPLPQTPNMDGSFFPPPFSGLQFPMGRPNTTCRICMKTFACYSALEIHYRSHTKERPFKCDFCDRGFSTKGNMKQHMLTHKIRDLPASLYTTTTSTNSIPQALTPGSNASDTNPSTNNNGTNTPILNMSTNSDNSSALSDSPTPNGPTPNGPTPNGPTPNGPTPNGPTTNGNDIGNSNSSEKRSSPTGIEGMSSKYNPKHVCRVCHKPFSSGSALQIHMRTHTGDKPFKCSICGRAFTTKGNLKVHMGTHMWSNGSSRRGRRMSIDLPNLHISPPKQLEFGSRPSGHELLMAHFN